MIYPLLLVLVVVHVYIMVYADAASGIQLSVEEYSCFRVDASLVHFDDFVHRAKRPNVDANPAINVALTFTRDFSRCENRTISVRNMAPPLGEDENNSWRVQSGTSF